MSTQPDQKKKKSRSLIRKTAIETYCDHTSLSATRALMFAATLKLDKYGIRINIVDPDCVSVHKSNQNENDRS